jgi:hypothetical protein
MFIVSLGEFWQMLESRRKELLSISSERDEILIQNASDEFNRLQQQLNREVAIRNLDRTVKAVENVQAGSVANSCMGNEAHCGFLLLVTPQCRK